MPQRDFHCLVSTTSCPLLHAHSQSEQHVSLEHSRLLPPSSSLASTHLNEHPRHGDEITHFWHFSAKSSMEAKSKNWARTQSFSGCPQTLPVSTEKQTEGTLCAPILLAWAKSTASRQSTGQCCGSFDQYELSRWLKRNSVEVHGKTRELKHSCGDARM